MRKRGLVATMWMLALAACGSSGTSGAEDAGASDGSTREPTLGEAGAIDATADAASENAATGTIDATADVAIENAATETIDATADVAIESAATEPADGGEDERTAPGDADANETALDGEASAPDATEAGQGDEAGQDGSEATDAGSDSESCVGGACVPPSCRATGPGTSQCGASNEDCCASLEVPGGTYDRTYVNGDGGVLVGSDPATVSGFRLDKYLVTVGRFAQFVAAWSGGWVPPAGSGKHAHLNGGAGLTIGSSAGMYEPGWASRDNTQIAPTVSNLDCLSGFSSWGNAADLPINCVNWFEAYAFCIWDGGFLPSEAEWELAAAGGSQQLVYPWGATAPGTSNEYAIYGCNFPTGSPACSGVTNIAPVGTATLGAGLWAQLDLAGELSQWTVDFRNSYATPCTDCASFTASDGRVVRGGSSFSNVSALSPTARGVGRPEDHNYDAGFRCARSP